MDADQNTNQTVPSVKADIVDAVIYFADGTMPPEQIIVVAQGRIVEHLKASGQGLEVEYLPVNPYISMVGKTTHGMNLVGNGWYKHKTAKWNTRYKLLTGSI